jgi:pyridinium-3,5-biscarboxylic acid mononucleotide sulfurtransferase
MHEDSPAAAKEARLRTWLAAQKHVVVAYSAGVDSTYLLAVAHQECGSRVQAITADSASLARTSRDQAVDFCRQHGIAHRLVSTDEFSQPEYLANDGQRCYHCKAALMTAMHGLLQTLAGDAALALGVIADDLSDWRPGMKAAAERGAVFPLAEVGLTKAEIRERSQILGLSTWDRPAEPCLSSRVPYGEPVTVAGLRMVEQAEAALHFHGFATCRARHHRIGSETAPKGWLCRIEIPDSDIPRLVELRAIVVPALKRLGYAQVTVDLAGFVSGGGNALK